MGSGNNGRNTAFAAFNPGAALVRWLDWMIRPTLPAVLGMLSTVTVLLVFAFTVSDAALYRLVLAYPLGREDAAQHPYVFRRLQRFYLDEARHQRFDLALIGGSSSRESLWTEAMLAAEIERVSGRKIHILDLTTGGQRLLESWALAELAACDGADIVMFAVNVNRFMVMDKIERELRDPFLLAGRLGPDVEAFVESGGANSRHATLTHRIFDRPAFVVQTISTVSRGILEFPLAFIVHDGPEAPAPDDLRHKFLYLSKNDKSKAKGIANMERLYVKAQAEEPLYPMFERALNTVKRCGARLIAFIPPVNPEMIDPSRNPACSAAYAAHGDYLRAALGGAPVPFLNELVEYRPDDFYDWTHLMSEEAIKATTSAMARAITPMLEEMGI